MLILTEYNENYCQKNQNGPWDTEYFSSVKYSVSLMFRCVNPNWVYYFSIWVVSVQCVTTNTDGRTIQITTCNPMSCLFFRSEITLSPFFITFFKKALLA